MDREPQQFASDNYSGMCPEALESLQDANRSHTQAYGEDPWTQAACDRFREIFECNCDAFFVFNGTAANSLALATACQSYNAVIAHPFAHIETDECGAPQFFSNGAKILLGTGDNGKLTSAGVEHLVTRRTDLHYPQARVVSLTQATELGTVYSIEELNSIAKTAHEMNLKVQMDGARFANAVAHLGCSPKDITWKAGVDVLCFGGTKNGLALGEAVIFFDTDLAREFEYRCKQAGQLCSKMRFLAAQWLGILQDDVWLMYARHANKMAELLSKRLRALPGVRQMFPREANSVFIELGEETIQKMHDKGWLFYTFIGVGGARLMCSWDTTEESIESFVSDLRSALGVPG